MAGLIRTDESPSRAMARCARLGARAIQLDGTAKGLRARELGRSARRDLAAGLRRLELELAGIDLWIPPEHFASGEHADRALAATAGALGLAAELAGLLGAGSRAIVSARLPDDERVRAHIESAAASAGAVLADHATPPSGSGGEWLRLGLDPAAVLGDGGDPIELAGSRADRLATARLSDISAGQRALPGEAGTRVDPAAYAAVLSLAEGVRHVVIDTGGLERAETRVLGMLDRWGELARDR